MNKRGILCILVLSLLLISPVFAHRRAVMRHGSYDVYVGSVRQEDYAYPGDYYWMTVNFENNLDDKPDLRLSVYLPELGVYERKMMRNSKLGKYSEHVLLPIPKDAEPGEYLMKIVISSDCYKKVKYRFIEVI